LNESDSEFQDEETDHERSLMAMAAAVFALATVLSFAASAPTVGSAAPEFTLPSQEGTR